MRIFINQNNLTTPNQNNIKAQVENGWWNDKTIYKTQLYIDIIGKQWKTRKS